MIPIDIEIAARQSYDRIADTYYSDVNPTTRLFDFIIADYLIRSPPTIKPNGCYIEVGAGKTKISPFMLEMDAQIILVDLCERMLRHSWNERKSCMDFLIGSAFRLPFRRSSFSGLYSFLGDPYSTEAYFSEAFRILKTGARRFSFITLPCLRPLF
jgi:ubiquinone/menaquinone biosynthesis C-methylase UbiE